MNMAANIGMEDCDQMDTMQLGTNVLMIDET